MAQSLPFSISAPFQHWLERHTLAIGREMVLCHMGTRKAATCLKSCSIVCHSLEQWYLNACSWMTCFPLPAPSLLCYNFAEFLGAVYFEV